MNLFVTSVCSKRGVGAVAERRIPSGLPPRPLDVSAVADHLGVSASHVRKLCAGGKLRHFRAGVVDGKGPIRIPVSALEECKAALAAEGIELPPYREPVRRGRRQISTIKLLRKCASAKSKSCERPISFVYFIQGLDGGPVKIGTAEYPKERLAALQSASPTLLQILGCIRGDRYLEREIHKEFAADRLHREWFSPSDLVLAFIQKTLKSEGAAQPEYDRPRPGPTGEIGLPSLYMPSAL